MKQNPFSFYDFLGYLIPGAFFLYMLYFFGIHYNWHLALELKSQLPNNKSFGDILNLFPLVISSYIMGHLLALTSSYIIEQYSNDKNGYPSFYLIAGRKKKYFRDAKGWEIISRCILFIIILPISLMDFALFFLRQDNEMNFKLKSPVFNACKKILKERFAVDTLSMNEKTGIDGDAFRLIYHFAYENSEQHANKLQNYVALYGFTRNLSMATLTLFWLLAYLKFTQNTAIGYLPLLCLAILSLVFYKGFVKFYRRYSLEAMMAACIIKAKEDSFATP